MNPISLFSAPGAVALANTLVHSLWEGALVALLLALALCLVRSPRTRYAMACLMMLALLTGLGVTFMRQLPENPVSIHTAVAGHLAPVAPIFSPPTNTPIDTHSTEPLVWLAPLWLAGVLIFHLRAIANWFAARRLRTAGVCSPPDPWLARLNVLQTRLRMQRPVLLLESCLAEVPVVIGYVRPVILMPVGLLTGLPAGQVEAILLHELAHIRRYDYLVNLLQVFVEGLLFYHPAVWWLSRIMCTERENCCDDVVIEVTGAAHEFATALTALEQRRHNSATALAATDGSLAKRIRRLLGHAEQPYESAMPVLTAAALTLAVVTAISALQSGSVVRANDRTPPPPAAATPIATGARPLTIANARGKSLLLAQAKALIQAQSTPPLNKQQYDELQRQRQQQLVLMDGLVAITMADFDQQRWVQDVAYIISAEEKRAFQQLHTTAEREKFIDQFWLKRDPTPGTSENEFRDEYYRRLAFTNEHFGTANLDGWKSDRGRVYILYGPPDELDPHPSGGSYRRPLEEGGAMVTGFPVEYWRYRAIPALGDNVSIEFADPAMTGEFHLVMKPEDKDALLGPAPPRAPAQSNIRFTQPAQEAK